MVAPRRRVGVADLCQRHIENHVVRYINSHNTRTGIALRAPQRRPGTRGCVGGGGAPLTGKTPAWTRRGKRQRGTLGATAGAVCNVHSEPG